MQEDIFEALGRPLVPVPTPTPPPEENCVPEPSGLQFLVMAGIVIFMGWLYARFYDT